MLMPLLVQQSARWSGAKHVTIITVRGGDVLAYQLGVRLFFACVFVPTRAACWAQVRVMTVYCLRQTTFPEGMRDSRDRAARGDAGGVDAGRSLLASVLSYCKAGPSNALNVCLKSRPNHRRGAVVGSTLSIIVQSNINPVVGGGRRNLRLTPGSFPFTFDGVMAALTFLELAMPLLVAAGLTTNTNLVNVEVRRSENSELGSDCVRTTLTRTRTHSSDACGPLPLGGQLLCLSRSWSSSGRAWRHACLRRARSRRMSFPFVTSMVFPELNPLGDDEWDDDLFSDLDILPDAF